METKEIRKGIVKSSILKRNYDGKFGKIYCYSIIMMDGTYGEYQSKSQNQTKFVVGKKIEYTLSQREYSGNITWMIKPAETPKQTYTVFGGGKIDPQRELSIIRQSSLNRSIELVVANKIKLDEVIIYGERFVNYIQTGK